MLEEEPELEVIVVPIGGGTGAAGVSIVAQAVNPHIQVIGVQSEASRAAYESWRQKRIVEAPNRTFAEGLATGVAFELPQKIMQAMVWMIERAHTLAEGAGAASLAAAYRMRDRLKGKKVGLICSGGNTSLDHLKRVLAL